MFVNKPIFICFYFICFFPTLTQAKNPNLQQALIDAESQKLFSDKTWQRLLHINVATQRSDITSPSFFYSNNKSPDRITSKNELFATIRAFFIPLKKDQENDSHAVCRTPARYFWLAKQINLPKNLLEKANCENLQNWAKFESLDSVSLILVSGYFGNPASTFGHLLVKINNSEYKSSSGNLLDQSINYGAKIPDNEPMPLYIARGFTGRYLSSFTDKKFYKHDQVYSKHEFRDMWEYELNLTSKQKKFFVYHVWEMLGQEAKYYFLKENCAYRITELLELVTGYSLKPSLQPWYLPITIFQQLEDLEGSRYIKKISYIPSSQQKLYHAFKQLSSQQVSTANRLIESPRLNEILLKNYDEQQSIEITDALLDYFQYKIAGADVDDPNKKNWLKTKNTLLLSRLSLPLRRNKKIPIPDLVPPAKGADAKLWRNTFGYNTKKGVLFDVGMSAVNYGVLTNSKGSLKNAELKVLDLAIQYNKKNSAFIKKLDFISIRKFGLLNTRIKGEDSLSWRFKTGYEQYDLSCVHCGQLYIRGGVGKAQALNNKSFAYALIDGRLSSGGALKTKVDVIPYVGLSYEFSNKFKINLELGKSIEVQSGSKKTMLKLESRYLLNRNNSLRASYEKHNATEVSFSLHHFWN